ncbi:MAG: hypothetical protein JEZ11_17100 [Desulfobacterales bacterium]|nr:hypothetical protein [Desulfobacterales bacterium]
MTRIVEKETSPSDFYRAALENGTLVMHPYCACGNGLDEDYFCEKCQRECHCHLIICQDEATLDRVRRYIRKSSQFSGFKSKLVEES